jgi:hypothetical protein
MSWRNGCRASRVENVPRTLVVDQAMHFSTPARAGQDRLAGEMRCCGSRNSSRGSGD